MKKTYIEPDSQVLQFYTENVILDVSAEGMEDMAVDKSYEYSGDLWY